MGWETLNCQEAEFHQGRGLGWKMSYRDLRKFHLCIPVFVAWQSNPSFCEVFPSSLWFLGVLGLANVPVAWTTVPLCIHWPPSTTLANRGWEHLRPSYPILWGCKDHRILLRESSSEAVPRSLPLLDLQSYYIGVREGAAGLWIWTATSLHSLLLSASCHTFPSFELWKHQLGRTG